MDFFHVDCAITLLIRRSVSDPSERLARENPTWGRGAGVILTARGWVAGVGRGE